MYAPPALAEAFVFAGDGGWPMGRLGGAIDMARTPSTMVIGVHGLPDDDGRLKEHMPGFDASRLVANERFFIEDAHRRVRTRFDVALPAERTAVWGASLGGDFAWQTASPPGW